MTLLAEKWPFWVTIFKQHQISVTFITFGRFSDTSGRFWSPFRVDVAFTQEREPSQTIKKPKKYLLSHLERVWGCF